MDPLLIATLAHCLSASLSVFSPSLFYNQLICANIQVTAGSGFVAHHIVVQLLEQGYSVRTTARGVKVERLRKALAANYDSSKFDVVDVPDIASGDFSEIMKDVKYIIHTAAPLPGKADFETALKTAIQGSVHVLEEGYKAGIRKAVVTTSMASFPYGGPFGANDFNPTTKEEAAVGGAWLIYTAEKTFADKAVVAFQDAHPALDVTMLGPLWCYGPLAPGFEHLYPEPDYGAFSTNGYIYSLLSKQNAHFPPSGGHVDVRDAARAHILALTSPSTAEVGLKRFPLVSPHPLIWKDVVAHIARNRPELKDRLLDESKAADLPAFMPGDMRRNEVEKVVGFKQSEWIPWEKTVLDAVDSLLKIEKAWEANGFTVAVPTTPPVQFM